MTRIIRTGAGVAFTASKLAAAGFLILSTCFVQQAAQAHTQTQTGVTCNASDPAQIRLQVSVRGMHSTKGHVAITIYPDDPAHFLNGAYKVARQLVPVTLPVTHACFVVAAPAHYAVALFHDENNTGHFETTALGLPADGFGFSNNPTLYFGPPNLSKVRFAVHQGDNPIDVTMKYYF